MIKSLTPPASTTILVIGGGPAGSYAATALVREGFDVTLIERDVFPRYHVGESMLPSCRHFLRFIGAEDLIKNHGFMIKPGGAAKLRQDKREGYADIIGLGPENITWNVIRSQFDELLLRHASKLGVKVFEGLKVTGIKFSDERPISAIYEGQEGKPTEIHFKYLVDASGRTGIMSTKYLKNRQFLKSLMNMAFWGYWRGGGRYAPGTNRENAIWIEAFTDETGWAWYIPLHDGTVSVGVVISRDSYMQKKPLDNKGADDPAIKRLYTDQLAQAPGIIQLLGKAELTSEIRSAGDFSYSTSKHAGLGYRIVGDAGVFIDPLFASGVHLAFTGALSAASTVAASIRGDCSEAKAVEFHNTKIEVSYTRYLAIVCSTYKQIRAQAEDVLTDADEDNFDKAFRLINPLLQGAIETDPRLTPQELGDLLEFCKRIVVPAQRHMDEVPGQINRMLDLTAQDGPALPSSAVSSTVEDDDQIKHIILGAAANWNAEVMHRHGDFRPEILHGYYLNVVRGELGMRRA